MPLPGDVTSILAGANQATGDQGPEKSNIIGSQVDANYVAFNQLNLGNVAEGTNVPPRQQGEFRIPKPNAFQAISVVNTQPQGALIVFTWKDIDPSAADIAEYRILTSLALNENEEPTEVGASQQSPCHIRIISPAATSAVFYLRPYLTNGQTIPLDACPTCTVDIPEPVFQFASGNDIVYIDDSRPQSGGAGSTTVVTFEASGTWMAPANVTSVTVECWGAGGNGGGATVHVGPGSIGGGGGGGGGYATNTLAVVPGTNYTVSVAGAGSELPTYFNTALILGTTSGIHGETGNTGGVSHGGAGGAGGAAGSNTASATDGGNGGAAGGGGGGGGGGGVGSGGAQGVVPGGGGGGGGYNAGNFFLGGDGARGQVTITYTTAAGGSLAPGIGVVNSNGRLSSLTDLGLLFINPHGDVTAVIGTNGTGSTDPGYVGVYDGTAGDAVVMTPGHVATATGGAATLPANPTGFLKFTLGGTAIRIPYYGS